MDALFFREDLLEDDFLGELNLHKNSYRAVYATLFNIIRAYNIYPLLIVKKLYPEGIEDLHALLKPSGMILCGRRLDEGNLLYLIN